MRWRRCLEVVVSGKGNKAEGLPEAEKIRMALLVLL